MPVKKSAKPKRRKPSAKKSMKDLAPRAKTKTAVKGGQNNLKQLGIATSH
jgi:hypothetical protein